MKAFLGLAFLLTALNAISADQQASSWVYHEEAIDSKGIGSGCISNKIWKLYAKRIEKGSSSLQVSGYKGAFYGSESEVYSINLADIKSEDGKESFKATKIGRMTGNSKNNYLYDYRNRLSEVIAKDCMSFYDDYIFANCKALTNVVLNVGFGGLKKASFEKCTALVDIFPRTIGGDVANYSFSECTILTGSFKFPSATVVGENAFSKCDYIEEVIAPDAKEVKQNVFNSCDRLTNVVLSSELAKVPYRAFYYCKSLRTEFLSRTLGTSLTFIGQEAFYGCANFTSLVWDFPNLKMVATNCFVGCGSLGSIVFKTPVAEIAKEAFCNIKPGAEVYMHKMPPTVFGSGAICIGSGDWQTINEKTYPRVYLSGNIDEYLSVIRKYHHVILKEDFNNKEFSVSPVSPPCLDGNIYGHSIITWQRIANQMAKDREVCEAETTGTGNKERVTKISMKKKGVIGFALLHSSTGHAEYGFWIMSTGQKGFSVLVR